MTKPRSRDPWRRAPVGELGEQLLPRWFVLFGLVMIPVALAVLVWAFLAARSDEVPVEARRPPPADGYTNAVGEVVVGHAAAAPVAEACAPLQGIRIAGDEIDRNALRGAVAQLCRLSLGSAAGQRLQRFAGDGGVVRFAVFEHTGVDSTAREEGQDRTPLILVNVRFARTPAAWIAPLIVHDATLLAEAPGGARGALRARQAEHVACRTLLRGQRPSRACEDAAELLALPDPLAALRAAGYE